MPPHAPHIAPASGLGAFSAVRTGPLETNRTLAESSVRGKARQDAGASRRARTTGSAAPAIVEATLQAQIPRIRSCYEAELRRDPRVRGKVTVAFSIQPGGAVEGTKAVENSTGSPAVARCVVSHVGALRFAEGTTADRADFTYPFVFGTAP